MNRLDAIRIIIDRIPEDALVVCANGAISREAFYCQNREGNFYLLGSMGLPGSVGLGIALHKPGRKVIVLDGDGNLLMGFGNLALIGALKPENLIHVILDNQAYGTTGNQPTISPMIPLSDVAGASDYKTSCSVRNPEGLGKIFFDLLKQPGPHFIQVDVTREVKIATSRIPYSAREMKQRFKKAAS